MSRLKNGLLLLCAVHDETFELVNHRGELWQGKCIHCHRKVLLHRDGKPCSGSTLEHIWPRAKGGDNHPDNLAIACSRCNSQKGRKVDILADDDPTLLDVVQTLKRRKQDRFRADLDHVPGDLIHIIKRLNLAR